MNPAPGSLRILLLGGFEVWSQGQLLRGFESQKVRALLAYLAYHRGRALSRDHLAGLLWGNQDGETARRNLRQAVYSLRATLPGARSARPHLVVDSQELRFDDESEYWLDVEAFEEDLGLTAASRTAGGENLASAVQHYRGDLLAGFLVKECPEFEEWLVTTQERLRATALEALRRLVASYVARGEFRMGIQHARRLVAMDPLSEEGHRQLLLLYDLAGQRGRALAHYTDLRALLRRELGVEPLPETRKLHERILSEALRAEAPAESTASLGPIVPLVGRRAESRALTAHWQEVLDGSFRLTLLTGEEGIGKTRLARSFLDSATSGRRATVLVGACREQFPQPSFGPLAEALRQALPEEPGEPALALPGVSVQLRRRLAPLLPELGDGPEPRPNGAPIDPNEPVAAVAELLRALAGEGLNAPDGDPVVLFFDDLHWADAGTLALLEQLPGRLAGARVWLLGTYDPADLGADHPLLRLAARTEDDGVARLELGRLSTAALEEIASAVVDPEEVRAVVEALESASGGLPLALVTLVNSLWDEGALVSEANGRWNVRGSAARWRAAADRGLDQLLLARVRRLPTSTRRLASMAAVIGHQFDTALLQGAEGEHPAVVDVGLELLLERWLVRQLRERWNPTGLERSLALWSRGARRGRFQFDHPRLRAVLYRELNPIRRQVLHRQIATALEELHEPRPEEVAEALAHHYLLAGIWDCSFRYLQISAERARAALDPAGALHCLEQALRVLERLTTQAADDENLGRWTREEAPLRRSIAELRG